MSNLMKFKTIRKKGFVSLSTKNVEERELSWKAKGLFLYLLSRPSNWIIRVTDLVRRSTDGKASLYSGLKELITKGYVHRQPVYEKGKIKVWGYLVFEEPPENIDSFLLSDFQEVENLEIENRDTYYYNSSSIKQKTLSNERVIPEINSGFNGTPILLRIKRRKKKNNNGLLYNSNKPRRYKPISLNLWNQHPLNKSNKYDPPIIALQDKIKSMRIKEPAANETKEVIDYWNKIASQLSNNGHKLPSHRLDLNTITSYRCKLIVTGILHTTELTVEDIKKAIDNYTKVLQNSHYYTHLYSFPQFYGKEIFSDCIEGNLGKYIREKKKKLTKEGLLEVAKAEHKLVHGRRATYKDEEYYMGQISGGHIKTEDDARRYVE